MSKLKDVFGIAVLTNKLDCDSTVYLTDSNLINKTLKKNSVDFLITSPPDPNTYDYYLYHKPK